MISVNTLDDTFELIWLNGQWRDRAGHLWLMDKGGNFTSKEHGYQPEHRWKVNKEEP